MRCALHPVRRPRTVRCPPAVWLAGLLTAVSAADGAHAEAPEAALTANAPTASGPMRSGWEGLASASLAVSGGSSDSATALVNLDLARKLAHSKTSLQATLNYSEALVNDRRETSAHKWLLAAQQDRNIDERWFAFAKASIDGDRILELSRRTKLSTGLGYHLLADERTTADVFGGFSYGDRRYRQPQTLHGITADHFQRPGGIFGEETTHQWSESVTVKQRFEAYPDFSHVHAHSANFNGSLGVVLTQQLSLTVTLASAFNQYAPPGAARTDTSLFTGFSLRLGG